MPSRHRQRSFAARVALAAVVAVLLASACSDDANGPGNAGSTTSSAAPTTAPTSASTTAPSTAPPTTPVTAPAPVPDEVPQIALQTVATTDAPIAMATRAGTSNLYIAERPGRVRMLDPASGQLGDPILDISADVSTNGERGLLGLAFSPDGERLYVSYTNEAGDSRLDEYAMAGDAPDVTTRRNLFAVEQPASNHNGGNIAFGPDGMLWYGLGDGGGSGDRFGNAQDTNTLLGSILRVDASSRADGAYGIPPDNPFVNGGGRPEVWLYGVRNPWRFSFDRATGDLWIGDVGQNAVEEIDVLRAPERGRGANLQWPLREGFQRFSGDAPPGSVDPIFDYGRDDGSCSITGGFVYRGADIAALRGAYVFGDYCEGTIRALFQGPDGPEQRSLGANAGQGSLVSFGQDADGELYTLGLDGTIAKIVPAPTTTTGHPSGPVAPNGLKRPRPPASPAVVASEIELTERALRDPATPVDQLAPLGHRNQVAYRTLGSMPSWDDAVIAALPPELADTARAHVEARRTLAAMHPNPSDVVPAWQIVRPEPPEALLGYYHEAEAATGIEWEYLAAINLVETGFGRIDGLSVAGAQGPMQFLPTTWAEPGIGEGDIDDPHDAIQAAARYLVRRGGAADMQGALRGYNNSANYVRAVSIYADLLRRDERTLRVLHNWQIHYLSSAGDLWLPVGYHESQPVPAVDYLTRAPWSAPIGL